MKQLRKFVYGGKCPDGFEIIFSSSGNTIIGNYALAEKLYAAKPKMFPLGHVIQAETETEARRLIEHVQLFHNCLESKKAWQKVCELSDCSMAACSMTIETKEHIPCGLCRGTGWQKCYEDEWACPACNGEG